MISTVIFVCLYASSAFAVDVGDDSCAAGHGECQGEQARALLQAKRKSIAAKAKVIEEQTPGVSATGAGAPLTEAGYLIVATQCCNHEMREFIRRVVFNEGMQVCNEGGLYGITPYYSCQAGPQTLAKLKEEIQVNVDWKCPWVDYASGDCSRAHAEKSDICPPIEPEVPDLDCGCMRSNSVNVDFFGSTVTHSNLNGVGPDGGAANIVYSNIGTFNGQALDLIVTADAGYKISISNPNATNGKRGKFGTINVLGGATTELTFQVVKAGTTTPQVLNEVHFSLFDLDQSFEGKMKERIYAAPGFNAFVTNKDIEFDVQRTPDGKTAFMSTQYGVGCDNPSDPEALGAKTCNRKDGTVTIDQRKRSVMMVYREVSSWKLTVEVTCDATVVGGNDDCQSGRNVLFAGTSSLKDRCEA